MARRRPTAASGALAVVALLGPACSLLLDFSAPIEAAIDAAPADAPDTCTKDEPNDELAAATAAVSGTVTSSICPAGDRDVYGFALDGATDLVAALTFVGDGGARDLEMTLYDVGSGEPLTVSIGLDDDERIEHTAAIGNLLPAGDYALEIAGRDDAVENAYALELQLGAAAPDAGPADAAPL